MPMDDKKNSEKSSDRLTALFEGLASQDPSVTIKKMFGWPCCFVNGNLFAGLHKQSMIFRLSDAECEAILALGNTGEFEPMPGRKMKGYVAMADPLDRKPMFLRSGCRNHSRSRGRYRLKRRKRLPRKKPRRPNDERFRNRFAADDLKSLGLRCEVYEPQGIAR